MCQFSRLFLLVSYRYTGLFQHTFSTSGAKAGEFVSFVCISFTIFFFWLPQVPWQQSRQKCFSLMGQFYRLFLLVSYRYTGLFQHTFSTSGTKAGGNVSFCMDLCYKFFFFVTAGAVAVRQAEVLLFYGSFF